MTDPAHDMPAGNVHWRQRLIQALQAQSATAPGQQRYRDDFAATTTPTREAGVLIPVVGGRKPFVYFTQRSDALPHHAGQISFPGGSAETFDANIEATALRETQEEIGLVPSAVEILGALPPYCMVTGFRVSPFVGWIEPGTQVTPDGHEVARLFGVPLTHALDHRNFRRQRVERNGWVRELYYIDYAGNHIWGATAGMLYGLLQQLAHAEKRDIGIPRLVAS